MPLCLAVFGVTDWLVLGIYLLAMVGIGLLASRNQHDAESYFLGSRSMPVWAVGLSILATALSAATFIGAPAAAFKGNLTYLILNIGGIIAAIIVAVLFIPAFYRAGTITIYGYLGKRFGESTTIAASVCFLIGRMLASGARLFMAAIGFSLILYGNIKTDHLLPAIALFGAIGTLYTVCGGIKAVIWTDVVQILVVVGAALLGIVLLVRQIPLSASGIVHALQTAGPGHSSKLMLVNTHFDLTKPYTLWAGFAIIFLDVASYGVDQDLMQRMLTCKTAWRGSVSLIGAILLGIPVTALFMVTGLLLFIFYKEPGIMGAAAPTDMVHDARQVYPQFLLHHLPTGASGLAMAGLFAAAMSSLDSAINAMASTVVADIWIPWRKRRGKDTADVQALRQSRWAVGVSGGLLTLFAMLAAIMQTQSHQGLLAFALGVMSFAYGGLLGVFLTALLTNRGNGRSAVAALVVGFVVILILQPFMLPAAGAALAKHGWAPAWLGEKLAFPWWMVIATAASFAVCAAGRGRQVAPQGDSQNVGQVSGSPTFSEAIRANRWRSR